MSNRVDRGWKLYLQDAVTVDFIANDSMAFDVKSSSGKEIYKVDMVDDTWNCSCHDFHNRNKRESTKQLICMHIHASMFKLAELYRFEELKKVIAQVKKGNNNNVVLKAFEEIEGGL